MAIYLKTSGIEIELPDKEIKEVAGIKLVGKGAANMIQASNENLLKILENFSSELPPENPIEGQLWYDKKHQCLKLFNGFGFTELTNVKRQDEFQLKRDKQWLTASFDIINNSFEITRNGLKLSSFEYTQNKNKIQIHNSKKGDIIIISN